MNSATTTPRRPGAEWGRNIALPAILAIGLGAVAISSQSFWIDETTTADIARQATLATSWQTALKLTGSSLQMPLYMFYAWGWEKCFGHSEWWLRAANVPWLVLGLAAIPRRQRWFLLVVLASPFVWYYLDEARPYAMQVGVSLLMLGALWHLVEMPEEPGQAPVRENFWTVCFCWGVVALCGSSLLGVIWAAAALAVAFAVLGLSRARQLALRHATLLAVPALAVAALAWFYLWTLRQGARASSASTGARNAFYAVYELLGFAGLGPGRAQIAVDGLASFRPFAPWLVVQAVATACALVAGCKQVFLRAPRRVWLGVAGALGGAAVLLLAAGMITHFRVLGRHFAPLAAALLLLMALGARSLWERAGWKRLLAGSLIVLNLASAASIRLAQRHAKDDYRAAAAIAITATARGERVWWCADGGTSLYFGVPLSKGESAAAPGRVWLAADPTEHSLASQPPPQLVILSARPDLHDPEGRIRAYLERGHYSPSQTLSAFTVWRR